MEAAEARKAPALAPAFWSRAERAYRAGERYFQAGDFEQATKAFREAKLFAERAENFTVLKAAKDGGS
jgi:hypothetical protein